MDAPENEMMKTVEENGIDDVRTRGVLRKLKGCGSVFLSEIGMLQSCKDWMRCNQHIAAILDGITQA